jgi:hypothetical protein
MRKLLTSVIYRNSTGPILPGNEPYFNFLKKGATNLELVSPKVRTKLGFKINVPLKSLGRE